jgi:protein O-mannosyl-transferase
LAKRRPRPPGKAIRASPPAPETAAGEARRLRPAAPAAAALAALTATWILYAGVLHGPFVFDDVVITNTAHYHVQRLSDLGGILAARGSLRKLVGLTFGLNHYAGGLDPYGYHLVNLALHALTGVFLFLLARRLLERLPESDARRAHASRIAAVAALFWLAHPVQSQAVAYVWQRSTLMAAAFFLGSLLAYAEGRSRQGAARAAAYGVAVLSGLLALFCKENTATLPLFVLLVEVLFFQAAPLRLRSRTTALGVGLAAAFVAIAAVYLGPRFLQNIEADYVRRGFTMGERVLTEARVVVHYLTLVALPHPSRLHLDYDFPLSRSPLAPPATALALLALAGLVGLAVYNVKRDRLLSFALAWFLGNLVIESSVIPLDIVYEHRLYLPSMFLIVWLLALVLTRALTTPARQALLAVPLLVLGAWTIQRARVWADPVTLFADNARKAPGKARVHWKLGRAYMDRGDFPAARDALARALALDPGTIEVYNNLAAVHLRLGEAGPARDLLEAALRRSPGESERWTLAANLGNAYMALREPAAAARAFREALQEGPPSAVLARKLALAQLAARDFPGARTTLAEARARWPDDDALEKLETEAAGWMGRPEEP